MPKTHTHTHTHLRLGLFGIQIASHRVCVLNVLPASGDMNYSKKQQQKMWQGVAFRDKGVGQRGKGGKQFFVAAKDEYFETLRGIQKRPAELSDLAS